ncbi:MAG: zinc transport system substrate-binding protein, partial [Gammaproteobacteria bacterium]
RRVQAIRHVLEKAEVRCVFSEPQQQPRLLDALTDGLAIRRGVLDPLGSETARGVNGWLHLMQRLATDLHACLAVR